MLVRPLPDWALLPEKGIKFQKELVLQLREESVDIAGLRLIAGLDVSSSGVVVWDSYATEIIETAFAEGPHALQTILGRIKNTPDAFMVDESNVSPYAELSFAKYVGLMVNVPTIGINERPPTEEGAVALGPNPGDTSPLRIGDQIVGALTRTKARAKPLFVSPGNRIDWPFAVELTLRCCRGYPQPEPTRLAHLFVNEERVKAAGTRG